MADGKRVSRLKRIDTLALISPKEKNFTFPEIRLDSSISSYHLSLAKCLSYGWAALEYAAR